MTKSPTDSPSTQDTTTRTCSTPDIPIEIIPDEEMALIEAAFASATRTISSLTRFQRNITAPPNDNIRSIKSITLLSKKRISRCSRTGSDSVADIEDSGGDDGLTQKKKKQNRVHGSLLHKFRRKRGLSVTDITAGEWCEKQMEFTLNLGRAKSNKAMEAGIARHAALEEEVVKKVKIHVASVEDTWAVKFMNFILGANQLLFDGLTRELPLVSFEEGLWMVGVIDEIRMPVTETERYPTLVDTKTRARAKLPTEAQQRNGRLQLMCYKRLWDNLVADKFPSGQFFDFFALNPHVILSDEIREHTAKSGFPADTLNDLVAYYRNTCCMLPPAQDQLLLRYEYQEDQSLIGEDQFAYDADWLNNQLKSCLEFWRGEREPSYAAEEERWKCNFCSFYSQCPANSKLDPPS
ncbi:exonuclease V, chloroplastic isoform X1 [Coffea arabica]|uniref:Exonuclease V, chloroplastic isoform X1 n=1 Tax=Coffea arabica TaxID=13443 RepID=A0A6P6U9K3_COFAR|nr:exonuclease V, chloroplastic-like isoform X1 [Coffea arabica]